MTLGLASETAGFRGRLWDQMAIHLHLQLLPRQRGHMELFFTTSQPNWLLITSRQRQGVVLPVLMIFDVYYLHGLPSTASNLGLAGLAGLKASEMEERLWLWCRYQLDTVKQCRVCGLIFFAEHNPIFLHLFLLSQLLLVFKRLACNSSCLMLETIAYLFRPFIPGPI